MIDFQAKLTDGKYHEVDSNALTFDIAARAAFRELAAKGAVKLLEPIMKVEVVTPDDFLGGVIGDLNSRRGQVQGTDSRGNAPGRHPRWCRLPNMFGYHQHAALHVPGTRAVLDAVRSLRTGSAGDRGRSQSQIRLITRATSTGEHNGESKIRAEQAALQISGTIGHVDHGKTSLTAAITKVLAETGGATVHRL